jgi:hypothetical protein
MLDVMTDFPETTLLTLDEVRVDGAGIHPLECDASLIRWSDLRRVALGREIHPWVTTDFHFWGLQTAEPYTLYRAITTLDDELSAEIRRRFGAPPIPPIRKWRDAGRDTITYVVWPPEDLGKALYRFRKKHWWSWSSRIFHALP